MTVPGDAAVNSQRIIAKLRQQLDEALKFQTASGEVLQVGRHGVSGEKASTLAKAAFEITIPTIVDAAIKGTRDTLRGVAENVIVGQQVPMGTGLIEVYMSMPEKGKK